MRKRSPSPNNMAECRAVSTGFSTAFRRPAVWLAEVAWRWAFAVSAWLVIAYGVLLFLGSVPVSDADMLGLSGVIPSRVIPTIIHIFAGSGPKMARLALALLVALCLLSFLATSFGRAPILRSLLVRSAGRGSTLVGLNLLRAVGLCLVVLTYAGCAFLIAHSSTPQDPARPVSGANVHDFSLLFGALACVIAWLWARIDARLTLAGIVSLRRDVGVVASLADATDLSVRRLSQFAWVGFVFGFIKLVLVVGAFLGVLSAFSMFAAFSTAMSFVAVAFVLAVYSALANFFTIGALAAQIRVIEWDEDSFSG
jgi:hypothetical protein